MRLPLWLAGIAALAATAGVASPTLAGEGEFIVLREVPPRIAYRKAPPAAPFAVRTSRAREIVSLLEEPVPIENIVTDVEAAAVSSGVPLKSGEGNVTAVGERLSRTLEIVSGTQTTGNTRGTSVEALQGLGRQVVAAGDATRRAVNGLAGTLTGAIHGAVAPR